MLTDLRNKYINVVVVVVCISTCCVRENVNSNDPNMLPWKLIILSCENTV